MTDIALNRDIALRIGLAARALPDMTVTGLLTALDASVGLPLDPARLASLRPADLKSGAGDALDEVDPQLLKQAVAILKGEASIESSDLPEVAPLAEGDMPGSLRVAVASNGGDQIDGHFGSCQRFLVYQVGLDEVRLVAIRSPGAAEERGSGDKNAYRANLIGDCQLLYVLSIGGPAAAKVVRRGVHPIKQLNGGAAPEVLAALQKVMAGAPPPWLAKVMGQSPEQRIRFESSIAEPDPA